MPNAELTLIRDSLLSGDKAAARHEMTHLLNAPTPDVWTLAALASETKDEATDYLRRALELDPFHTQANHLLHKLEREHRLVAHDALVMEPAPDEGYTHPIILPEPYIAELHAPVDRISPWRLAALIGVSLLTFALLVLTFNMLIGMV